MKSFLMLIAATALVVTLTGCGSLRTPSSGPNANKVYYNTFFGVSVESAVYGDGVIVDK